MLTKAQRHSHGSHSHVPSLVLIESHFWLQNQCYRSTQNTAKIDTLKHEERFTLQPKLIDILGLATPTGWEAQESNQSLLVQAIKFPNSMLSSPRRDVPQ